MSFILTRLYQAIQRERALRASGYPQGQDIDIRTTSTDSVVPVITTTAQERDPEAFGTDFERLPSLTPSEVDLLNRHGAGMSLDLNNFGKYLSVKYLINWLLVTLATVVGILSIVYQDRIVRWLEPAGDKLKSLPGGWLIPIVIFIILSYPPLFGHEIVAIVCGVVWGLGPGFGIVVAGTILGELLEFYTFLHCCHGRAEKWEKNNISYGLLAQVVREGGFIIIIMARLSALPAHFTTVLFSLSGVNGFTFLIAVVLTLFKQFSTVYLGVISRNSTDHTETKSQKIATGVIIAVTVVVTIIAMRYINLKANKAKPAFILARRRARAQRQTAQIAKSHVPANRADGSSNSSSTQFPPLLYHAKGFLDQV